MQHSGSFKARGAFANLLLRDVPSTGVVAASGGNHGAAVAYAGQRLGILRRWHELLKPGGELRISVPDLGRLAELYHRHSATLSHRDLDLWLGIIYGGQDGTLDFHAAGFTFVYLRQVLEECGFENVRTYPHQPHFWPGGHDAASEAAFCGEYIFLNVIATKRAS